MNALTTCQSNQPLKGYSNRNDWKLLELRKLTRNSEFLLDRINKTESLRHENHV